MTYRLSKIAALLLVLILWSLPGQARVGSSSDPEDGASNSRATQAPEECGRAGQQDLDSLSDPDNDADSYFGVTLGLAAGELKCLRKALETASKDCGVIDKPCAPGEKVLKILFKGTYRSSLPDVILYISRGSDDRLQVHRPLLLWQGKNTPYVFGAPHIYALVISDAQLSLEARMTTVEQAAANPFASLLSLLNVTPTEPEAKAAESAQAVISWQDLSQSGGGPYLGWARLKVDPDSINRLTITERTDTVSRKLAQGTCDGCPSVEIDRNADGPEPFPGDAPSAPFHAVTVHISNSRPGRAGFGFALGTTWNVGSTGLGGDNGNPYLNGYALAKLYFRRPRLLVGPSHKREFRRSVAFVLGTNVASNTFDDIVAGVSFGHLRGKVGFTVGVNAVKPKAAMDSTAQTATATTTASMANTQGDSQNRRLRLFLAVDYTF